MILLRQEGKNLLLCHSNGLICNHIEEVWNTHLFSSFLKPFSNLLLENLGHPNQSLDSPVSDQPLPLGNIVFAVAHKTRCDGTAADRTCQGGELHATGGHPRKIPIDGHHTVAHRKDSSDTLTTTARRHRIINQTVKVVMIDLLTGGLEDEIIDPFPLAQFRIDHLTLLNGLVRPGGIDLERGLAIHPVVSTTESCSLRADDTDMVGCKGLTERAGVEGVRCLIGHPLNTGIPFTIVLPRFGKDFIYCFHLRIDLHLNLVKNGSEILMELCMEDFSKMGELESLIYGSLTDSQPGNVPLANMHDPLGIVDQMVDLSFKDGLEVFLHLTPCDFCDNSKRKLSRRFDLV